MPKNSLLYEIYCLPYLQISILRSWNMTKMPYWVSKKCEFLINAKKGKLSCDINRRWNCSRSYQIKYPCIMVNDNLKARRQAAGRIPTCAYVAVTNVLFSHSQVSQYGRHLIYDDYTLNQWETCVSLIVSLLSQLLISFATVIFTSTQKLYLLCFPVLNPITAT